jgi:hypothetical protein
MRIGRPTRNSLLIFGRPPFRLICVLRLKVAVVVDASCQEFASKSKTLAGGIWQVVLALVVTTAFKTMHNLCSHIIFVTRCVCTQDTWVWREPNTSSGEIRSGLRSVHMILPDIMTVVTTAAATSSGCEALMTCQVNAKSRQCCYTRMLCVETRHNPANIPKRQLTCTCSQSWHPRKHPHRLDALAPTSRYNTSLLALHSAVRLMVSKLHINSQTLPTCTALLCTAIYNAKQLHEQPHPTERQATQPPSSCRGPSCTKSYFLLYILTCVTLAISYYELHYGSAI